MTIVHYPRRFCENHLKTLFNAVLEQPDKQIDGHLQKHYLFGRGRQT